jgi:5-methylcytosine-specific restriction protein A
MPGSPTVRWTGHKLTTFRRRVLAREPLCRHCTAKGVVRVAEEVDHVIPLENGGTYALANVQPLCKPCHSIKTAQDRGYRPRKTFGPDGFPID